jgi:D-Tyr-tRNAtyr deacylase|tara:strand:+ start:894 stop:1226 length:333 start_codon:yes stop_codon:yes gene_type:complete
MAIIANLFIDQGTDFQVAVDVSDSTGQVLNLSGYTSAGQIRKTYGSSTISATFTTSNENVTGKVTLSLTDTQTSALEPGRYVYDMNITSAGGITTRVVEGQAIVTPGVTR